jgi:hypothetical protein
MLSAHFSNLYAYIHIRARGILESKEDESNFAKHCGGGAFFETGSK